jgi:endonuclease/exonuclease/phosphatase family metal-dependent hydrolase
MHLVSYNIRYGLGRDRKYDLKRIAQSVEGADIIALQEVEQLLAHHRNWQKTGGMWSGHGKVVDASWSEEESAPVATPRAILMGDFNTLADSETYQLLSGHHEPDYGRVSYIDEFVDSLTLAPDDESLTPYTYWTDESERNNQDQQRLDYCFVSSGLTDRALHTHTDTKAEGSDHFPYWVEMDL